MAQRAATQRPGLDTGRHAAQSPGTIRQTRRQAGMYQTRKVLMTGSYVPSRTSDHCCTGDTHSTSSSCSSAARSRTTAVLPLPAWLSHDSGCVLGGAPAGPVSSSMRGQWVEGAGSSAKRSHVLTSPIFFLLTAHSSCTAMLSRSAMLAPYL